MELATLVSSPESEPVVLRVNRTVDCVDSLDFEEDLKMLVGVTSLAQSERESLESTVVARVLVLLECMEDSETDSVSVS